MRKRGQSMVCLLAGIAGCASALVFDSSAQTYPDKPIRWVVGYSPGGITDASARMVAPKLSELLGQSVIIENRPGAAGAIATERVAASPADGYTLLLLTIGDTVRSALRAKLPYDLERDLAPVSFLYNGPFVLVVHPSVPAHNIKELIALARSRPGKLTYGSVGVGSTPHLSAEALNLMTGVKTIHVPYKGGADAAVAAASGHIDIYISSIPSLLPLLAGGRLRPLAVTSAKRVSFMPSLPTLDESGVPGYSRSSWGGVGAPAGVPKDIIARLNAAVVKAVSTAEMKESLNKQGLEPQTGAPEEFAAFIRSEIEKNAALIKSIGIARLF